MSMIGASGHYRSRRVEHERLSATLVVNGSAMMHGAKRSRRRWSEEEKRHLVAEACQAGASVAEIARRHGVNANLLFTWRRAARAGVAVAAHASVIEARAAATPAEAPTFIPLGVFGQTAQAGPALTTGPSPALAAASAPLPQSVLAARSGVIEIDLPDGTRLRLDTLVNERALRRVLSVLKGVA